MSKIISNNIAVCLLYAGRLKEGLQVLETSITADTTNIQVNIYACTGTFQTGHIVIGTGSGVAERENKQQNTFRCSRAARYRYRYHANAVKMDVIF